MKEGVWRSFFKKLNLYKTGTFMNAAVIGQKLHSYFVFTGEY
jgi:hypothetical protein